MQLELTDQAALIVGGAQGIGRAIAEAFAAEGARVFLADVIEQVSQTADHLARTHGIRAIGHRADATDFAAMQQTIALCVDQLGTLDHLVYAAGAGSGKFGFPFWNLEPDDWNRPIQVNLLGAVNATHAAVATLTEKRQGTVLYLASIAGQIGSQTDPPYSAAKAALINFAQCAAKDFAPYNVRVNTICPGMVQTEVNRSVWKAWYDQQPPDQRRSYEDWAGDKVRAVAPLGRWQQPEEIAALAVFLASPHACNITGQTLNVDGGQVMHW